MRAAGSFVDVRLLEWRGQYGGPVVLGRPKSPRQRRLKRKPRRRMLVQKSITGLAARGSWSL